MPFDAVHFLQEKDVVSVSQIRKKKGWVSTCWRILARIKGKFVTKKCKTVIEYFKKLAVRMTGMAVRQLHRLKKKSILSVCPNGGH